MQILKINEYILKYIFFERECILRRMKREQLQRKRQKKEKEKMFKTRQTRGDGMWQVFPRQNVVKLN